MKPLKGFKLSHIKKTAKSALRAFRSEPLGAGVTPAARREGDLIL